MDGKNLWHQQLELEENSRGIRLFHFHGIGPRYHILRSRPGNSKSREIRAECRKCAESLRRSKAFHRRQGFDHFRARQNPGTGNSLGRIAGTTEWRYRTGKTRRLRFLSCRLTQRCDASIPKRNPALPRSDREPVLGSGGLAQSRWRKRSGNAVPCSNDLVYISPQPTGACSALSPPQGLARRKTE